MLQLLETCVKNCGKRFHIHIATKEFMQEMIKLISPKYNPSVELQNTVLSLIQVTFLYICICMYCVIDVINHIRKHLLFVQCLLKILNFFLLLYMHL